MSIFYFYQALPAQYKKILCLSKDKRQGLLKMMWKNVMPELDDGIQ